MMHSHNWVFICSPGKGRKTKEQPLPKTSLRGILSPLYGKHTVDFSIALDDAHIHRSQL